MYIFHLHLYQPERADPWLEIILPEPSASPYRHWNERVSHECYEPNAELGNYQWVNFDVGPTLLTWLRQHKPLVYKALLDGDRFGIEKWGHGNALAHPYFHVILPLVPRRDREVLVAWGVEYFKRHFKRSPEGMWLPEMAVDLETLETLVDYGIVYTVLTQSQVKGGRGGGPYKVVLPSGRSIVVFVRNESLSNALAFGGFEKFLEMLRGVSDNVVVALDGETFGHHIKGTERQLAQFIDKNRDKLINFGALYEKGPRGEVEIVERTSWSCPHGLGRWSRDCGCDGPAPWREDLRKLIDWVGEVVDQAFYKKFGVEGRRHLLNYIEVLMGGGGERYNTEELKLLEAQRAKLAANSSDAWFFARVGIEFGITIKWALRAVELLDDKEVLEEFTEKLNHFIIDDRAAIVMCPKIRGPLMAAMMYISLVTVGHGVNKIGAYEIKPIDDEFEIIDTRTRETFRFRHDLLWGFGESFKIENLGGV
ncbi:MAG: glycoside hydrolase [Pyrobaculum sp.]